MSQTSSHFFNYPIFEASEHPVILTEDTALLSAPDAVASYLTRLAHGCASQANEATPIGSIRFHRGLPKAVRERLAEKGMTYRSDAYAIRIAKRTHVYAVSETACVHAVATLARLMAEGELREGFLFDTPLVCERGYRTYLPPRTGFAGFEAMLDLLVHYKYNSIILEIGGAMEYERHPEIAVTWSAFCKEMRSASGKSLEIQHKTYPWPKNSIHSDNAEGDILTKEECRHLAALCRERGIEVIPECPTFSHCDYLVLAHPEIREREADGHPDSYCPRHPDTYRYVFDILDEVIEVFAPKRINIGHDEAYTVALCPRCRGASAPVLYAEDVKTIHAYLQGKGVKTMMWGEKLLNARTNKGYPVGGAGHGKGTWHIHALYPSRDLLPRDVTYLHWYWPFHKKYDRVFHERGMHTVYGNLSAFSVKDWDERLHNGMDGGYVGNWGSLDEEYMQRNQQYFDLVAAAYAFFCPDFGSTDKRVVLERILAEAFRLKTAKMQNPIYITHTTEHNIPYEYFYDGIFIVEEKYLLGHYILTYADGTEARLPVRFGTHIGCKDYPDAMNQGGFRQTSYGTLPLRRGEGYAYKTVYENPHPDKALTSLSYQPQSGKEAATVELLGYSVEKPLRAMYRTRPTLDWGDEFAMDGGI